MQPSAGLPRCVAVLALLFSAADSFAVAKLPPEEAPESISSSDSIPRHELESRALLEPENVLAELPALIESAEANRDWRELAFLYLAQANACRVVANWQCQREAGAQARQAAQRGEQPLLVIRGLIADSRASIALQDFSRGEHLLGEAERLLKLTPLADLTADVYLAYSSLSYSLGKHTLAAEYADRGLAALGEARAPDLRARLLRNRARAQAQLGDRQGAQASLYQAQQIADALADPKLSAELLVETARLARLTGDAAAQSRSGNRVLELADKLKNSQLRGLGHEILGLLALDNRDNLTANRELRESWSSFQSLAQQRDELRVLRELIRLHLHGDDATGDLRPLVERFLHLHEQIETDEHLKASADFDARLKYAEGEIELMRLKDEAILAQERERSLAHRNQLTRWLMLLAAVVAIVVLVFFGQLRRSNARLRQVLARQRESESLYRTLADYSSDLVVRMRMDGRRVYVSPSAREMLGYDPAELTESRWELLHPDDREKVALALQGLGKTQTTTQVTYRVMSKRGHYIWIEALARLVPSVERPGESEIIYSGRDVTQRIEVEHALAASQKRLKAVTDNIPALVAQVDMHARYRFVNAAHEHILGISAQTVVGMTMRELHGAQTWAEIEGHVATVLRGERVDFSGEASVRGVQYFYQANYVPDFAEDGSQQGFFALTFDITPLKRAERELERLTREDSLTGLANRRDFDRRLPNAIARCRRRHTALALCAIDIDHFKRINDSYGHPVGDLVIRELAQRLRACVREEDLVARIGGDEFVVLIEDVESPAAMEVLARTLVATAREPIATEAGALLTTVSIGVGFSRLVENAAAFMTLADQALYSAKAAGRDTSRIMTDG